MSHKIMSDHFVTIGSSIDTSEHYKWVIKVFIDGCSSETSERQTLYFDKGIFNNPYLDGHKRSKLKPCQFHSSGLFTFHCSLIYLRQQNPFKSNLILFFNSKMRFSFLIFEFLLVQRSQAYDSKPNWQKIVSNPDGVLKWR